MEFFEPICIFGCEDCGDFLVALPEHISIFSIDEEIYAITRCPYCDRVTKNSCDIAMAETLMSFGVKFFDWNEGESFGLKDES